MNAIAADSPLPLTLPQAWRQALPALLLLLGWIFFLYRDTAVAMVSTWSRSETFTHGFLVPPIVLWLVWRERRSLAVQIPRSAPAALGATACVAVVWLLGELAAAHAVTQTAFVGLLVLAVPALLGGAVARLIAFPLGFLFFAVPVGDFLLPQLMEWTADFTVYALRLSGIPVYREGLNFVIPSGSWSVVEACSGVRYLIASVTVGTLFAYLNYQSTQRRLLFVLVSLIVPIVANWLRAYLIVMLGHLSDNKLAVGVDHLIYGWVFFGVVIMLMFLIGARWAEPEKMTVARGASKAFVTASQSSRVLWKTGALFALLATLPQFIVWALDPPASADPVQLAAPQALTPNWQIDRSVGVEFKPSFRNPSAEFNAHYADHGRSVGLYLGYYSQQDYSRKLISSSNVMVASDDPQWARVSSGSRALTVGDKVISVRTAALRRTARTDPTPEGRLIAWQIYWVNGTLTAHDYLAKAYGVFYKLLGRGDEAAVIIVYTLQDQPGDAEPLLESFLSSNQGAIHELLLKARKTRDPPFAKR